MIIEACAALLVLIAAIALGYRTGYQRGRDDAEFERCASRFKQ